MSVNGITAIAFSEAVGEGVGATAVSSSAAMNR
jgi:hypothetical protein